MFVIFQLLLLFIVGISITTLFKNKTVSFLLSLLLSLFLTLQSLSVYMNGNLIDYKFYEHANISIVTSVGGFFLKEIILFSLLFVAISVILYAGSRKLRQIVLPKWVLGIPILIGLFLMILPDGIANNIYSIIDLKTAKEKDFSQALKDLGIDPEQYVVAEDIEATAGKNIIVLSLESFERGYLEAPLEHLTPNLRKFGSSNTLLPMRQNDGSQWTTGSMYTVMTGMPSYFKSEGNEIFQDTKHFSLPSLGKILRSADYKCSYLIGNKEFSGIMHMLEALNFDVYSERDFDTSYEKINWGIHDKDLFEEAKKKIKSHKSNDETFALFLSTISGHYPDGVYDSRMENILPAQESNLEFMTAAVDYYIGDLIAFLERENLIDNTAIYIFPDHTLMKNQSAVLKKFKNKRGLFFISNVPENILLGNIQEPILQIDIPRMIINGAKVRTNATFITDYIGTEKHRFIQRNKKNLLSLNEAALKRTNFSKGFRLSYDGDTSFLLSSLNGSHQVSIPGGSENILKTLDFSKDMRLLRMDSILGKRNQFGYTNEQLKKAFKSEEDYARLIFSRQGDSIIAYFQTINGLGITRFGEGEIVINDSDIEIFDSWNILKPSLTPERDKIFLRSTGYDYIKSYGTSVIYTGHKPHEVTRGLNVLYLHNNKFRVRNFDTYSKFQDVEDLLALIKDLKRANLNFYIVSHDSAEKELQKLSTEFKRLGFKSLSALTKREAYIGYHRDGNIEEFSDEKSLTKQFKITPIKDPEIVIRKSDTMRFVAHAGGAVNGRTYTNSLEALQQNYAKGFRIFELDFIKTSDSAYVAAHDWEHWAKNTQYSGALPPSRQQFMESPIDTLTPLDMNGVNNWFEKHSDAILVTDKVNRPLDFVPNFRYRNRLMMELFSLKALKEAQQLEIRGVLASEGVLKRSRGNVITLFNDLDVNYVAISRRIIKDELSLLKKLRDAGIKTYVFHVNFDKGRDENFVVENEMDYVYGMYADFWDFPDTRSTEEKAE